MAQEAMNKERISQEQVLMLMVISRVALTVVYYGVTPGALEDGWWLAAIGAVAMILCAWVTSHLWRRFPTHTFAQVAEIALGKTLGKGMIGLYLLVLLLFFSLSLRLTGEFFVTVFLSRTPMVVVIGMIALLLAWGAVAGIEVIARAAQVVFPIFVGAILLMVVLLLKDIQVAHLLPPEILHTGPVPHLQDIAGTVSRSVEYVWLGMLIPFVADGRNLFPTLARAHLMMAGIWMAMGVAMFGVLGRDLQPYNFPFFQAVQMIDIADFIQRVDALFLGAWLLGMFMRTSMILWASALCMAQWLGLKHYRPLVLPLAGLGATYAMAQAENFSQVKEFISPEVLSPLTLTVFWLLPWLVLGVAVLRGLRGEQEITPASCSDK